MFCKTLKNIQYKQVYSSIFKFSTHSLTLIEIGTSLLDTSQLQQILLF